MVRSGTPGSVGVGVPQLRQKCAPGGSGVLQAPHNCVSALTGLQGGISRKNYKKRVRAGGCKREERRGTRERDTGEGHRIGTPERTSDEALSDVIPS
jgi:hypothetical protein